MNPFVALLAGGHHLRGVRIPTSLLAFRLRGDYFAVGTWVIAEVYRLIIIRFDSLGGPSGMSLPGDFPGMDPVLRGALTYWAALALAALTMLGCYLLMRGRIGLALTAVRDDEIAARANGVDVTWSKRLIYLVSAAGMRRRRRPPDHDSLSVQPDADLLRAMVRLHDLHRDHRRHRLPRRPAAGSHRLLRAATDCSPATAPGT